jgi:hypothetical protein
VGKPERERDHWNDLGVDGRIIIKWILNKFFVIHGLGWHGSGWEQATGYCKFGSERSGSTHCGIFF